MTPAIDDRLTIEPLPFATIDHHRSLRQGFPEVIYGEGKKIGYSRRVRKPTEDGFTVMEEYTSIGIHAGPLYGALAILAAVIDARATGTGCAMEVAQSDAAAFTSGGWVRSASQ